MKVSGGFVRVSDCFKSLKLRKTRKKQEEKPWIRKKVNKQNKNKTTSRKKQEKTRETKKKEKNGKPKRPYKNKKHSKRKPRRQTRAVTFLCIQKYTN